MTRYIYHLQKYIRILLGRYSKLSVFLKLSGQICELFLCAMVSYQNTFSGYDIYMIR